MTAVHDISDGGLSVAVAKMAVAGGVGAKLDHAQPQSATTAFAGFFGEDQARYIVTTASAEARSIEAGARALGISITQIGVTGGNALTLPDGGHITVADLRKAHESWLPGYMAGKVQ